MKKSKRKYDEVNYWESMADSLVALLLCVLLITLLLILYLVRIPEEAFVDLELGNSYEQYHDNDDGGGNHAYGDIDDEYGDNREDEKEREKYENSGGGGGGEGGTDTHKFDDPDPGSGEGYGTDKAAVFVQVLDGETSRTIKKEGLQFELYGSNSSLQVLHTYYPEKIEYKKFQTDEAGVFYLPEKISLSSYYLQGLTTIEGYDATEKTEFSIKESYDWDDPYVVTIGLYPSKNIIRLQLKDSRNGKAISGAAFQVIAAEDIVTKDGTTRYKNGDVVDTITVDNSGYGESKELYLGKYLIRQTVVPAYYGKITTDTAVEVESKTKVGTPGIKDLREEKTSAKITVTDALYDTTYISEAKFKVTLEDGTPVQDAVTDQRGQFTVTNLNKNTTYHIRQLSTMKDYRIDQKDHIFKVDENGLIDGKTEANIQITNQIIRISVGVQDMLFRGQVSDVNVALYNAAGRVVRTWNTTGLEQTIEGLAPGEYKVILDGKEDQANIITVEDAVELQSFQFDKWTTADFGAILALCLLGVGIIALLIFGMKHRRRKKSEDKGWDMNGK